MDDKLTDFHKQPIPESIREVVSRILKDISPYPETPALVGIYAITNEVTKQVYIGSSKNIYNRLTTHIKMLHAKKHHSYKLQRSFNTHGLAAFSFKIIEEVDDPAMLFTREQYYLDLWGKKRGKLLNVSRTADSSDYLKRKSRRTKRKTTRTRKKVTSGKT